MKPRHLWILIVVCSVLFMPAGDPFCAEETVVVATTDSEGINKLIETSKGTVIVAMAAWCHPCREELPILVKLYEKYKSEGLEMVGISLDPGGPSVIQPVLNKARANFPVYWVGEKAMEDLNIRAIPLFLFVKDGAIVEKVLGKQSEAFLDRKIVDLLKDDK